MQRKKLDDFQDHLKEKKKTIEESLKFFFEKLQNKTRHARGPLAKLLKILEDTKPVEDEAVQTSANKLLSEDCAIPSENHARRKSNTVTETWQWIVWKKIRNHIADTIKSKRVTRKIFIDLKKKPFLGALLE